jgi:hypothetical protein
VNPRAYELIAEIRKFQAMGPTEAGVRQTQQAAAMAELLVLLAEEQAKSAAAVERQTNKIIRLTWGLFWLTLALTFVAAVQLYVVLK